MFKGTCNFFGFFWGLLSSWASFVAFKTMTDPRDERYIYLHGNPISSKHPASRCFEPFSVDVLGVQSPTHQVFGCLGICIYIYYRPRTQMTLVLIEKGPILEG